MFKVSYRSLLVGLDLMFMSLGVWEGGAGGTRVALTIGP